MRDDSPRKHQPPHLRGKLVHCCRKAQRAWLTGGELVDEGEGLVGCHGVGVVRCSRWKSQKKGSAEVVEEMRHRRARAEAEDKADGS